jgi:prolipoprotein diacylglyceryltransferase
MGTIKGRPTTIIITDVHPVNIEMETFAVSYYSLFIVFAILVFLLKQHVFMARSLMIYVVVILVKTV